MEIGTVYKGIVCTDFTTNAQGVCLVDGRKVFVDEVVPGEVIDLEITKVRSKYIQARVLKHVEKHDIREGSLVEAYPTATFGGCDLQWLNYEAQLEQKEKMAMKMMKMQARSQEFTFQKIVPSPNKLYYRNKIYFAIQRDKNGVVQALFYEKGSRNIQVVTDTFLADKVIGSALKVVLTILNQLEVPVYDPRKQEDGVSHIAFRYFESTNEMMLVLVTNKKRIPKLALVAQTVYQQIDVIQSVIQNINGQQYGAIFGKREICLSGKDSINDMLRGLKFNVPAQAFYQVNTQLVEKIYEQVMKALPTKKTTKIIDFYCGIGTISLMLSAHAKEVIGVDIVKQSIQSATINAFENKVHNAKFLVEDVDIFIDELVENGETEDLIAILDPPRKGCNAEFLEKLSTLQPKKIIYVSCNPQTLARDLEILEKLGYTFGDVKLFDMFPQTLHVESVVVLSRKK